MVGLDQPGPRPGPIDNSDLLAPPPVRCGALHCTALHCIALRVLLAPANVANWSALLAKL